jgi:hypothetical protein
LSALGVLALRGGARILGISRIRVNCYDFFPWRGDLFLVQYVNLNAH